VGGRRLGMALMHATCGAGEKRNERHLIRGNDVLHCSGRPKQLIFTGQSSAFSKTTGYAFVPGGCSSPS
jgi:hypothetical protein